MTDLSPLRVGRITGSRIAPVLGLSPYATRADVLREMVRQHHGAPDEFDGNVATDYGNEHEDDALAAYEQINGVMTHGGQEFVIHPKHDFLAVTPDGYVDDNGLVECKCPYRATYTHISERPDYEAQIRLQLECTGREWGDFVVWRESGTQVSRVTHDPDWLPSILPVLQGFMEEYLEIISSDDLAAPYLEPLQDQRTDADWAQAARQYLELSAEADRAKERAEQARQELLALTDKPASGAGVQVIRAERKGGVDYSRLFREEQIDVDFEAYRKPGSVVWSVRRTA